MLKRTMVPAPLDEALYRPHSSHSPRPPTPGSPTAAAAAAEAEGLLLLGAATTLEKIRASEMGQKPRRSRTITQLGDERSGYNQRGSEPRRMPSGKHTSILVPPGSPATDWEHHPQQQQQQPAGGASTTSAGLAVVSTAAAAAEAAARDPNGMLAFGLRLDSRERAMRADIGLPLGATSRPYKAKAYASLPEQQLHMKYGGNFATRYRAGQGATATPERLMEAAAEAAAVATGKGGVRGSGLDILSFVHVEHGLQPKDQSTVVHAADFAQSMGVPLQPVLATRHGGASRPLTGGDARHPQGPGGVRPMTASASRSLDAADRARYLGQSAKSAVWVQSNVELGRLQYRAWGGLRASTPGGVGGGSRAATPATVSKPRAIRPQSRGAADGGAMGPASDGGAQAAAAAAGDGGAGDGGGAALLSVARPATPASKPFDAKVPHVDITRVPHAAGPSRLAPRGAKPSPRPPTVSPGKLAGPWVDPDAGPPPAGAPSPARIVPGSPGRRSRRPTGGA